VTTVKSFIVEGKAAMEYCHLFFDFMAFCVNVVVPHDLCMGSPVVQLVCGFSEGVELVPGGGEEVAEPQ